MKINYHGRTFAGVTNSSSGQVGQDTIFQYSQHDNVLTAMYSGGSIQEGYMLGIVKEDNSLYFTYHHIDTNGILKSGYCNSTPELLENGRVRLQETWFWTHGGEGEGTSTVEEIIS